MDQSYYGEAGSQDEGRDGPEQRLDEQHSPEAGASSITCSKSFSVWPTSAGVDSDGVFNEIIHPWQNLCKRKKICQYKDVHQV